MQSILKSALFWRLLGATSSGLLLFAAFPPLDFAWAAWFSLLPVTVGLLVFPHEGKPWLEGFVFGASFFFPTLFWVTEVSWIGWLALAALMSLYPAVWLLLMDRFLRGSRFIPFEIWPGLLAGRGVGSDWNGCVAYC